MITKDTRIIDALQQSPRLTEVFERFGMGCSGCLGITSETIENGAKMHDVPLEELLRQLNQLVETQTN